MENTLLIQTKFQFSKEVTNFYPEILTDEAIDFIIALHEKFNNSRFELL
jgi:malate synthase